jgi:glycine oxidase
MPRTADVVIVGGGVIGLTTAYELARAGVRVIVLERGEPGREASWAGAGIIAPGNPEGASEPFERLRAWSAARFPSLSVELRELTGLDNGYRRCGGFEHVTPAGRPEVERWTAEGVAFEYCPPETLAGHEPLLPPSLEGAYFLPGMAQVRNPWHLRALTAAAARLGVAIEACSAAGGWERGGERVVAVRAGQESFVAGEYLVCGGAWTDGLLAPFGVRLGVRPVRGQMVLYRAGDRSPRFIHLWDKEYVVPRGDGLALVGSTEEDAGFDKGTTAEAIAGLRGFAEARFPTLAGAVVEQTWAGLRPASPDGLPFLGRVPGVANLSVAAGHFRSGIQLSPATGRVMAELLRGVTPAVPLDPFRPGRPPAAPARPAFRS